MFGEEGGLKVLEECCGFRLAVGTLVLEHYWEGWRGRIVDSFLLGGSIWQFQSRLCAEFCCWYPRRSSAFRS